MNAYDVYRDIPKGQRSAVISAALLQWDAHREEAAIVSARYRKGDIP